MKKLFPCGRRATLLSSWCLIVLGTSVAQAATFNVTSPADSGVGTLRQAILSANSAAGDDSIFFDLPGAGPHNIDLTDALPNLSSNISIINDRVGDETVTVRRSAAAGTANFRIFAISTGATVSISGLTISNGALLGVSGGSALGGAVRNDGTLTMANCTLSSNDATGDNAATSNGADGQGGAIYNSDTLTLTNCLLNGNIARGGSGVGSGRGGAGQGGAVYSNGGTVTLTNCAFSNNSAIGGGGAVGGVGQGGAIRSKGTLNLLSCTMTINGAGSNTGDAQGGGLFNSGTATLVGCGLSANIAASQNGGVGQGGGIRNDGTLSVTNSSLLGNTAGGGKGTSLVGPGVGGALYNNGGATIEGSTLARNIARGGDSSSAKGGAGLGGGFYNSNAGAAVLNVANSTVSQNRTVGGNSVGNETSANLGGGFFTEGGGSGSLTITGGTIALNEAADGTGILISGGDVTLSNTLVANNGGTGGDPSFHDVRGAVNSASQYNLIGDGSDLTGISDGTNGNQIGGDSNPIIDAKLGPLQANGGSTETHALLSGSPALDKGKALGLIKDQRGLSRPYNDPSIPNAPGGDGSDIGAYEERPAGLPRLSVNDITVTEGNNSSQATFTVTLSETSAQPVTVTIRTVNGTAIAPADYTATAASLTFAPGQTSKAFTVPVIGDSMDEENEVFYVLLSSPTNASLGKGRGIATINDDDATPSISIADAVVREGNSGQRVAVFRLNLSAPSGRLVEVFYNTQDGTATAPSDYTQQGSVASPARVAFTTGTTVAYIRVFINGDTLDELDETFRVNLLRANGATLTDNGAQGTILNDDSAPALTINDVRVSEGNSGTKTLTFTVSLSKASGQIVTANYATANGIARSDQRLPRAKRHAQFRARHANAHHQRCHQRRYRCRRR